MPTQVPSTCPFAFTFAATAFQPSETAGPNASGIEPAAIDAARDREHEHRARRGLFVGLAAVEQLVPEARVTLRGDDARRHARETARGCAAAPG